MKGKEYDILKLLGDLGVSKAEGAEVFGVCVRTLARRYRCGSAGNVVDLVYGLGGDFVNDFRIIWCRGRLLWVKNYEVC